MTKQHTQDDNFKTDEKLIKLFVHTQLSHEFNQIFFTFFRKKIIRIRKNLDPYNEKKRKINFQIDAILLKQ